MTDAIDEIFARHKRATLMYSGGKDSLACLLLCQRYWDRLEVVWVNTGNQFPEVEHHMETVRKLVPTFVELKSNTREYAAANGFPVDLVPTSCTTVGHFIYGSRKIKVCSRFDCCSANIWSPIADYYRLTKPECVIRGDRASERSKSVKYCEGTEYVFPLWNMTTEEVQSLVRRAPFGLYQPRHELPEGSSLDCMTCMAYNVEHTCRMQYLKTYYPELYEGAKKFFKDYKQAVLTELEGLED